MENEALSKLIPVSVLLFLGIIEALGGLYFNDRRTKNDFSIELLSLITLPTLIQPGIFLFVLWFMGASFPGLEDYYLTSSLWWQVVAFLILDDLTQYWWHRLSHINKKMWKLHRPHHVVEEMGVLVTYRNAVLYYAFMPGIWFSAVLIYLGMGYVYLFYLPIKLIVILLAHSETKWDKFLYRYKILSPLAWIIERTISTPSTHFAHHGLTAEDGVSHPNGNYGNLLFIWDIIFGTAKITRKYPSKFGAWNRLKEPWYVQLFFPIISSKDPKSELYSIKTNNDYDPSKEYKEFTK
ncbi:sterol desaturase family protein [Flavobacteriaceae bacterium]|nr:sterol desaturase family protein [Flavobacteriaceae bacterium]MDC0652265.1 sterol desaturase family protein [Flavobacteriaceae bacterium]MDC1168351.1 sterol desaturase family protein [Flavobacteriaceae bacterium]MDC3319090.1 sterol desaturase family protein [Flavobacteriaceae bacterium]